MLDSKSQENIAKIVEEQFRTLISVTPGMNFNVIPVVGVQSQSSMASYFLLSRTTLGSAINDFRSLNPVWHRLWYFYLLRVYIPFYRKWVGRCHALVLLAPKSCVSNGVFIQGTVCFCISIGFFRNLKEIIISPPWFNITSQVMLNM